MTNVRLLLSLCICGACGVACSGRSGDDTNTSRTRRGAAIEQGTSVDQPREQGPLVVFLGDSISAGHELAAEQAFPARLREKLAGEGLPFRLVNAGVSGDTTAGGLARLDWLLAQKPQIVVVELGANDGLRGLPIPMIEGNLRRIVERIRTHGAVPLLLGMRLPPSYGADYTRELASIYPRVAQAQEVAFVPFFMEGVAGVAALNLPDGIHPTAEGHDRLAANVTDTLRGLLRSVTEPSRTR